jgi:hypothetical protein
VPCESSAIRTFEESVVGTVRQWMRGLSDWGFKSLTHYEDGVLVVKGTIALARGVSLLRPARRTTQITRLPSPPFSRHTVQKVPTGRLTSRASTWGQQRRAIVCGYQYQGNSLARQRRHVLVRRLYGNPAKSGVSKRAGRVGHDSSEHDSTFGWPRKVRPHVH